MYSIPFHRRILPWVLGVILLIMAPTLIFYTSGYRWNSKKGVIERNGTMIIDSVPSGATVNLNGQEQPGKTPVTLQNISPGAYNISLTKTGYHAWSKSLNVEPERVTFVTGVNLWPIVEPELFAEGQAQNLITDNRSQRLMIVYGNTRSSRFVMRDTENKDVLANIVVSQDVTPYGQIWSYNADQLLVFSKATSTDKALLLDIANSSAIDLPQGIYHWSESKITGLVARDKITIDKKAAVSRTARSNDLWDQLNGYKLIRLPNAANLVLVSKENEKQGTLLPPGNWIFYSADDDSIILKNQNNWIWINTVSGKTFSSQSSGQWLQGITVKKLRRYVYTNYNEVWVWNQGENPALVYRQTDPIVATAWHSDGDDIMVATQKEIRMYNLDDRNGRIETTLANFDSINDAVIVNDTVFIAGSKNSTAGVWRIPLALPKTPGSLLEGLKF